MASFMEMSLYSLLLVLFSVFFGIPSVQKYQSKETIFLSSRKWTKGIEAPAVTLIALSDKAGYGWKTKTNQTSSVLVRYTDTFLLDHCREINRTKLEDCILNDSFELTDLLTMATFGLKGSSKGELNTSSWEEDMDNTANGRHFTWSPQKIISPVMEHFMSMSVYKNFKFFIFVHDIDYYFISTSPFGTALALWEFDGNSMTNHYQEITLIMHKKLNLDHQPCEESKDYRFITCVMESLAAKVGCRRPWDRRSRQDRRICTDRDQFKQFDMQFRLLLAAEVDKIERWTGCLKPCAYKEYKFVNSNPKPLLLGQVPDDQVTFGLWPASEYTQFEEEVLSMNHNFRSIFRCLNFVFYQVLLYPFTSLLAEFGGCLGLFLGFSFVTISDGLKAFAIWLKKNIKLF